MLFVDRKIVLFDFIILTIYIYIYSKYFYFKGWLMDTCKLKTLELHPV